MPSRGRAATQGTSSRHLNPCRAWTHQHCCYRHPAHLLYFHMKYTSRQPLLAKLPESATAEMAALGRANHRACSFHCRDGSNSPKGYQLAATLAAVTAEMAASGQPSFQLSIGFRTLSQCHCQDGSDSPAEYHSTCSCHCRDGSNRPGGCRLASNCHPNFKYRVNVTAEMAATVPRGTSRPAPAPKTAAPMPYSHSTCLARGL